jgi:uncharacterized membrane protein
MFFYLILTAVLTAIALVVFVFTLLFTSPKDSEGKLIIINLVYFFLSGIVSLAGILTLVLYWLLPSPNKEGRQTSIEAKIKPKLAFRKSLRHALLISLTIAGVGLLNSLDFANPLNIILLISAAVLIEIYLFGH